MLLERHDQLQDQAEGISTPQTTEPLPIYGVAL